MKCFWVFCFCNIQDFLGNSLEAYLQNAPVHSLIFHTMWRLLYKSFLFSAPSVSSAQCLPVPVHSSLWPWPTVILKRYPVQSVSHGSSYRPAISVLDAAAEKEKTKGPCKTSSAQNDTWLVLFFPCSQESGFNAAGFFSPQCEWILLLQSGVGITSS